MDTLANMRLNTRRVQGPGLELLGLDGRRGAHTAIVLPEGSPCRAEGLRWPEAARAFLERPVVAGLARLVRVDPEEATATYATGEVWSAAEVMVFLRRRGASPGLRAGVELAWRVADVLVHAGREAAGLGLRGHGAIDPWRVSLRRDGQVILIGHGVSTGRPEACCDGAELAEALRYAPPERLQRRPEDATSDLFSLSLLALEWMLGAPVYDGGVEEIRRAALEATGDRWLWAARERLPVELVELFGRALRGDRDARPPDAMAFADAARRLLAHPAMEGPSLFELMGSGLEAPGRFVGLAELRRPVVSGAPEVTTSSTTGLSWSSLGGRRATAERQRAAAVTAPEPTLEAPQRAAAVTPPANDPPAPRATPGTPVPLAESAGDTPRPTPARAVVDLEAETVEAAVVPAPSAPAPVPAAAPAVEAARPPAATPAPVLAAAPPAEAARPPTPAPMPVAPARPATLTPDDESDDVTAEGDEAATVLMQRPPEVVSPAAGRPRESTWRPEEMPTTIEPLSGNLCRLVVVDAEERQTTHLVDADRLVVQVAEEVVLERSLPRNDLLGATVFAWRLGREGVVFSDHTSARELGAEPLHLVRVGNRPVLCHLVARDDQGELWLTAAVGTAVPARAIVTWAVQVLGLEPGRWTLTVGGEAVHPDGVLEGRIDEGGLLELSR